jgi:hypothetical protein
MKMNTDILKSKKFLAATLASVLALVGMLYDLEAQEIGVIIAPLASYILAQGVADHGKERLKVPNR